MDFFLLVVTHVTCGKGSQLFLSLGFKINDLYFKAAYIHESQKEVWDI